MATIPKTMRAMQIQEQGGLEVLQVRDDVPVYEIKDDEVLLKVEWAGVNFIDTYQRGALYKLEVPIVLGNEPAGVVAAVGKKVDQSTYGFKVGDRVVGYTPLTAYGQYAKGPARCFAKLPDAISTKTAATVFLQGLTAVSFITEAHEVKQDQWILVHAAAGGLGRLFIQLCKARGAHVIGTTSTAEKAEIAKAAGAEHVILYGQDKSFDEVAEEVRKLTPGGEGVHAVFDGVGKDTFESNLIALRRKGSLISVGNASGAVPPIAPLRLAAKNLKLARPTLNNYVATREELQGYAQELFKVVRDGSLKLAVHKEYPFTTEGFKASQQDITGRGTTGKLLIAVDPQ